MGGLGALGRGLENYQGGVVIISHNTEFTDSVCTQKWIMEKSPVTGAGHLREEGEIKLDEEITEAKGPDEIYDESGNKIEVNKKMQSLTEEEVWELGDKLAELKDMLSEK